MSVTVMSNISVFQSATVGQKPAPDSTAAAVTSATTSPSGQSTISQTISPIIPSPASRIDDAPAMWRAGLRKTGSADIVCPTSVTERNDSDKLSRSSSVSWGPPTRANTIAVGLANWCREEILFSTNLEIQLDLLSLQKLLMAGKWSQQITSDLIVLNDVIPIRILTVDA